MVGKVKWFNDRKGYGFLTNEKNEDIFVHFTTIKSEGHRTLIQGEKVEFTLVETERGLQAKNVVEKSVIRDLDEESCELSKEL